MNILEGNFTKKEQQASNQSITEMTPRPEYVEGKIKLNFEHQFSTGEVFKAHEDSEGNVAIILERDGKIIFNFKDLFIGSFLTPTLIQRQVASGAIDNYDAQIMTGQWAADALKDIVNIGDMDDPKDIFILLHEIGHSFQKREKQKRKIMEKKQYGLFLSRGRKKEFVTGLIKNSSDMERGAWAWALNTARRIQKQHQVNIFEVFKDSDEFEKFIYGALITYRQGNAKELNELAEEGGIGFGPLRWLPEPIDIKRLASLFDKERLQRGSTRKRKEEKAS